MCHFQYKQGGPPESMAIKRTVRYGVLLSGRYVLKLNDAVVASGSKEDWQEGVTITLPSKLFDRAESLRQMIVEKNQLYFHRWRPQNETYLLGFRKHEQGNNAVEIPLFDPLVAGLEARIAKLALPPAFNLSPAPQSTTNP